MKFIVLLFLPVFGLGQIKPDQKISLLTEKVELFAPKELSEITDEMWKLKYGNAQRPLLALSDKDAEVNLIAQYTNQEWIEKELAAYKDFRISNLKKTRTDVQILEDGVKDINGKKVGFIKFMSQAIDTKIFNYYFFIIVDKRVLVFTFNCMEKQKNVWEKTADQMLASLKIK